VECTLICLTAPKKYIKISYLHILWAEVIDEQLVLDYASKGRTDILLAVQLRFSMSSTNRDATESWIKSLLRRSYGDSKSRKRILVLVNPHAGQGFAVKKYHHIIEPLFTAAGCQIRMESTHHVGHASELIQQYSDLDSWDAIACCSGDGLPYEVINGLAKRSNATHALANTPVVQLPCGSGNALCMSLFGTTEVSLAALYIIKGVHQPIDLVSITQGNKRSLSFCSQNLGYLAECDLGTEHMRYLGGSRVIVGYFQRILSPPKYPCEVAICDYQGGHISDRQITDTETSSSDDCRKSMGQSLPPLRFGTVNDKVPEGWSIEQNDKLGTFYAGKLPYMDATSKIFPHAQLEDGLIDIMRTNADVGVRCLLRMFWKSLDGSHVEMPEVDYRKAAGYRVTPKREDGYLSIDGEKFPFAPFQVEVHRRLGMTLRRLDLVLDKDEKTV
jgi:sphingosine kinase